MERKCKMMKGLVFLLVMAGAVYGLDFPGNTPGNATGGIDGERLVLENAVLKCSWDKSNGQLRFREITDKPANNSLSGADFECFEIAVSGKIIKSSEMTITGEARLSNITGNKQAKRMAEQFDGKEISVELVSPDGQIGVGWRVVMRDESNYVRQEIVVRVLKEEAAIESIIMPDITVGQARACGSLDGSEVVIGNILFAYEHPMAKIILFDNKSRGGFRCALSRDTVLKNGQDLKQSCIMAVVPDGQLRRGFLYYLERERTQPYRQFLNYNSWFDLSWTDHRPSEAEYLDVIERFGLELSEKRGVQLKSFAMDEGWDNPKTIWQIDKDVLPNGFKNILKAAKKFDSGLGVFMSMYGFTGYDLIARVKAGQKLGFRQREHWLTLQDNKYYDEVLRACVALMDEGVNYFKLDLSIAGMLNEGQNGADGRLISELEPQMKMLSELRKVNPDVFIDMTIGSWASPFWLLGTDTAWRRGLDCGSCGKGSRRQQWITYRDHEVYQNVVSRAPLYPLNSLQLHGVIFAQRGDAAKMGFDVDELSDELMTFFGSGTNVTSLFMTPSKMEPRGWDVLAETAKWYQSNADVLVDTHWVGGNPGNGEIYGWASWSKRKGILVLRNPDDKAKSIAIDIGKVFELPAGAAEKYTLKSPWKKDAGREAITLSAKKEHVFELGAFEVMVFDAAACD